VQAFGLNAQLVTGFSGANAILAGFEQGDGQVVETALAAGLASFIKGGTSSEIGAQSPCLTGTRGQMKGCGDPAKIGNELKLGRVFRSTEG